MSFYQTLLIEISILIDHNHTYTDNLYIDNFKSSTLKNEQR